LSSNYAVLAIYFDVAAGGNVDNPFITALQLQTQNPSITTLPMEALVAGLKKNAIYSYEGSLTTPPCTETVTWIINNEPQPISTAQLALITNHFAGNSLFAKGHGNNRATQPLNGRTIYLRSTSSESSNAFTTQICLALIVSLSTLISFVL
jgi:carbonic anhydrase